MPNVTIPSVLRSFTDRRSTLELPGTTVAEVIASLADAYPDLAPHILDEQGALRSFVNVYLGDKDIRSLQGPDTPVAEDSTILLIPSIAGGVR